MIDRNHLHESDALDNSWLSYLKSAWLKIFGTAAYFAPDTFLYDGYKLQSEREHFIFGELYDRGEEAGVAVADPLPWFVRETIGSYLTFAPRIYVFTGGKQTIRAIGEYGDEPHADERARRLFHPINVMLGTDKVIINMLGKEAVSEKKIITKQLSSAEVLDEMHELGVQNAESLAASWKPEYSFQDNMTVVGASFIAHGFLGMPNITIEHARLLRDCNNLIAYGDPASPSYIEKRDQLLALSQSICSENAEDIISWNRYISTQFELNDSMTTEEKKHALIDSHGGAGILVESNLSALLMFALAKISESADIRTRLREELHAYPECINSRSDLKKLPYLDAIYRESLRTLTPTSVMARETSRSVTMPVENYRGETSEISVYPNSIMFFPIRRIQHDPHIWDNPLEFSPDRFYNLTEDQKKSLPDQTFWFSAGKRFCPASNGFIESSFKSFIAAFFLKYDVSLNEKVADIPLDSLHPRWPKEYFATITPVEKQGYTLSKFGIR